MSDMFNVDGEPIVTEGTVAGRRTWELLKLRRRKDREQKLIDITFELVLASTADPVFCAKSSEEKAAWVAEQLRACGFDTEPCGANWGVLKARG